MYTGSKSGTGQGAVLNILGPANGTGTQTPTLIGEPEMIDFKEPPLKLVDVTNLQSTIEEQTPVIPGLTTISATFNLVANDPGQILLHTAFTARIPYNFAFILPKNPLAGQTTSGDSYTFSAYVTEYSFSSTKATEIIKVQVSLQYNVLPTKTLGT